MTDNDLFLYFCGSTFFTFLIAAVVLTFFAKDKTSRFAGYFVMKPIVVYTVSYITWRYYPWITTLDWTPWFAIHFLVEFLFLLTIVYWFRDLYRTSGRILWLFIVLDFLRWGSVLLLIASPVLLENVYLFIFIFFGRPVQNTIIALIFSFNQRNKLQVVQNNL